MRSLWRLMALRWLDGEGAKTPTGDSVLGDLPPPEGVAPAFRVTRDPRARGSASRAPETSDPGEAEDLDLEANRRA